MATTKSMQEVLTQHNLSVAEAENRRKALLAVYRSEKKVPIVISPMYQPYFGRVMQVMINGISIFVKVDGTRQMVPQTYADEIEQRRMNIDAILNKQHRLANIPANVESSPGELALL